MRRRLAETSRKVTVLRVNEKALTRRFTSMQEIEGTLRKVRTENSTPANIVMVLRLLYQQHFMILHIMIKINDMVFILVPGIYLTLDCF